MKANLLAALLFFLFNTPLKAQLKEFDNIEMPRPDVSIVQANTAFPEDALIIVYSSLDDLSFRSSVGAVDRQYYNARANRYEILVKPLKQMIFISATEFMEQKLATINPKPKEDYYFRVEEKKIALLNQTAPGKLTINSNPAGANISLNGISITNKTPFIGNLNPGQTSIQLSKSKFQTFDTVMNVQSSINEVLTINLKPSTLWLNINSNPPAAQVKLDGIIIGTTPLSEELDLSDKSKHGPRSLILSLPEYSDRSQSIQIFPSKNPLVINEDLKKTEGTYLIQSTPEGAEVFIDKVYKGITPLQGYMPIGTYSVELKMEDYISLSKTQINVNKNTQARLSVELKLKSTISESLENELAEFGLVKDVAGNSYKTVKIGNQVWMAENLKTKRYSNGDLIPNVKNDFEWDKLQSGAWCNYENLNRNEDIFGKLYNWYVVYDSRNICPVDWHVPTDNEWMMLINYLGGSEVAGGSLKSVGFNYWNPPNSSASNFSGFSANSGGMRGKKNGIFSDFGYNGYWWSLTPFGISAANYFRLDYINSKALRNYQFKNFGFSIRCIKD